MNKYLYNEFGKYNTLCVGKGKGKGAVVVFGLLVVASLALTGCASQAQRAVPPFMVSSIVRQSQDGVPSSVIIRQIAESGTVYRLSASELANLRDEGVADAVINYMQQTYLDAIRHDQSVADRSLWVYGPDGYYYGGYPFGWPYYYVPYAPQHEYTPRRSVYSERADGQGQKVGKEHAKNPEHKLSHERANSHERTNSPERANSHERINSPERTNSHERTNSPDHEFSRAQTNHQEREPGHHASLNAESLAAHPEKQSVKQ